MGKRFFRMLAMMNKAFLPSLWRRDLQRLNAAQRLIVAWRYWVTRNAL